MSAALLMEAHTMQQAARWCAAKSILTMKAHFDEGVETQATSDAFSISVRRCRAKQ